MVLQVLKNQVSNGIDPTIQETGSEDLKIGYLCSADSTF